MYTFQKLSNSHYLRYVLILNAMIATLLLAYWGKYLFIPLFFAFLIALFLYPFTRSLEKLHVNRYIASFLSVILLILFCGVIIYFVIAQFGHFSKDIPSLTRQLDLMIQNIQEWLNKKFNIQNSTQLNYINKSINGLLNEITPTVTDFFKIIILVSLFFFFTFYILCYRKLLVHFIMSFFNDNDRKKLFDISSGFLTTINSYIKGLLIEMLILACSSFIVLLLLGIKYALLMAVFAALFNIIPYIGIYTAALLNMLIALTTGTVTESFEVLAIFLVVHVLDANVIMPFIVGGRVKMNPFITLIAVVTGGLVWGIPGMFLFIPLVAIMKIIFEKTNNLKPLAILIGKENAT